MRDEELARDPRDEFRNEPFNLSREQAARFALRGGLCCVVFMLHEFFSLLRGHDLKQLRSPAT